MYSELPVVLSVVIRLGFVVIILYEVYLIATLTNLILKIPFGRGVGR